MEPENNSSISQEVLDKIKEGKVAMRSRAYFLLRTTFFLLGMTFVFLLTTYLISFILFSGRKGDIWLLTSFGWLLIGISLILIIALEVFAKQISFVHKQPVIYSLIIIMAVVALCSVIIAATPLHERPYRTFGPRFFRPVPRSENLRNVPPRALQFEIMK